MKATESIITFKQPQNYLLYETVLQELKAPLSLSVTSESVVTVNQIIFKTVEPYLNEIGFKCSTRKC